MNAKRKINPCIRKGGGCEKIFNNRKGREKGVELAIDYLLSNNCITINNRGWCKIIRIPKKTNDFWWPLKNVGVPHGGNAEIGWRRFMQDIAIPLKESKKNFRLSEIKTQGANLAALEFGVSETVKNSKISLCSAHRDAEYQVWKASV